MNMNIKELIKQLQERKISPAQAMNELKTMTVTEASVAEVMKLMQQYPSKAVPKPQTAPQDSEAPSLQKEASCTGAASEKIAIIGMAGKYPGVDSMEAYWHLIAEGKSGISDIPPQRCDTERLYSPKKQQTGHIYTKKMGVVGEVEQFDALFFEIAPSEADQMDPQQRVFMEVGYAALEDAGYCKENLSGKHCGVYLGMSHSGYDKKLRDEDPKSLIGNSSAVAAARLSYYLNLQGPALTVDTACSSGMVCTHLAIQALLNGEIDMAVAGGASIYLDENAFVGMCEAGMLSAEGISRPFDDDADGIVVSDGIGALILKRLSDAEKDHDHIYGVIVGSGMNQDGKTNGITAPNPERQQTLIQQIYAQNAINANDISYVEMHGTGTKLGDPIELQALEAAYRSTVQTNQTCAIGSVKSNLGHTSAASGIAGIQKILLCMQHSQLVPTIHLKKLNHQFDFAHSPFYVNQELCAWNTNGNQPRMAAVSSFGFSGTNVHMVLQEYQGKGKSVVMPAAAASRLFLLSAKTDAALKTYAEKMLVYLEQHDTDINALRYLFQCKRPHLGHRAAWCADTQAQLIQGLQKLVSAIVSDGSVQCGTALSKNKLKARIDAKALAQLSAEEAAAQWTSGIPMDWNGLYENEKPYVISAPTYPFERETHWLTQKVVERINPMEVHPFLHQNLSDEKHDRFCTVFRGDETVVQEHRVQGIPVLPGAAILEMALAAGRTCMQKPVNEIRNVVWLKPITISSETNVETQLSNGAENAVDFEIFFTNAETKERTLCAKGSLYYGAEEGAPNAEAFAAVQNTVQKHLTAEALYAASDSPLSYGAHFRTVSDIAYDLNCAKGSVNAAEDVWAQNVMLNPYLLDGIFQTASVLTAETKNEALLLPFSMKRMRVCRRLSGSLTVYAKASAQHSQLPMYDLRVADASNQDVLYIEGFAYKNAAGNSQVLHFAAEQSDASVNDIEAMAESMVRKAFMDVFHVSANRLDAEESFDAYGIDSVLAVKVADQLSCVFGKLSETILFEYPTIHALSSYLCEEKADVLHSLCHQENVKKASETAAEKPQQNVISNAPLKKDNRDIAIIGISGRFPMAEDMDAFWKNLCEGLDCVTEVPADRWHSEEYYEPKKGVLGKTNSKWGGFLKDAYCFDSLFFKMSPSEAEFTDPQIRVMLETAWHAMEDAGYTRKTLEKYRVGTYVGVMYALYHLVEARRKDAPVAGLTSFSMAANRISYFLNLHGPSIALDTMCSSSLTAMHLACQSIQSGEIDMAFAGGVNIVTHPRKYVQLSQNNFMSSDGKCRSFGADGDGYVPGEGAGCVVLKSLEAAERDHDHIYAVIKASVINAGGKAAGFTVPNMEAQANLIQSAIRESGIHPETIGYFEAHGTGTSLGDPIEINGMTKAYRAYTAEKQYCAIGSVKSNIGHLESAAGMASIAKVLLQMQHRMLVPSIHAETLNPKIDFAQTPFYVQRQKEEWHSVSTLQDGTETTLPLRAAVSAFGAGGSNAHMILENYESSMQMHGNEENLFVLSAKNRQRLSAYVSKVIDWLETARVDWRCMMYTFQTGREAMEERLAVCANSQEALLEVLRAYVRDGKKPSCMETGNILDAEETTVHPAAVQQALQERNWKLLGTLWIRGAAIDWESLYQGIDVCRISVPQYPFARVYHFLKAPDEMYFAEERISKENLLSPVLHYNHSNRKQWKFTSVFDGTEPFLKDHVLNGEKVLPGAAYLEMLTNAAAQILGDEDASKYRLEIRHLVWIRPFVLKAAHQTLTLTFADNSDEMLSFEIFSTGGSEKTVHCKGTLGVAYQEAALPVYEMASLLEDCPDASPISQNCYEIFEQLGLRYGTSHRCIDEIRVGSEAVLATLRQKEQTSSADYVLHPGIVDAAFQSAIALPMDGNVNSGAALPFAIDRMAVYGKTTAVTYAYLRVHPTASADSGTRCADIVLLDRQKQTICTMENISFRPMKQHTVQNGLSAKEAGLFLTETYLPAPFAAASETVPSDAVIFTYRISLPQPEGISVHPLPFEGEDEAVSYQSTALELFRQLKQIVQQSKGKKRMLLLMIGYTAETEYLLGLSGMMKTVQTENNGWICRTVGILDGQMQTVQAEDVLKELRQADCDLCLWKNGSRMKAALQEVDRPTASALCYRQNGVYLISGGTGALGLLAAEDMMQYSENLKCILLGRSPLKPNAEQKIAAWNQKQERVFYVMADVTDASAVTEAIQQITAKVGRLHGVLHCSGVLADKLMINKTEQDVMRVLAPKVQGLVNLDRATASEPLDFFVLYSSLASVIGNIGQCDYACGNGFLDHYANVRNELVKCGQRSGKTISVNWPLWKDGSMQVSKEKAAAAFASVGLDAVNTQMGMELLHGVLAGEMTHLIPLAGDTQKLRRTFLGDTKQAEVRSQPVSAAAAEVSPYRQAVKAACTKIFCENMKLSAEDMDERISFEEYGMDSVRVIDIAQELQKLYGDFSTTVLYECKNLKELTAYILNEKQDAVQRVHAMPQIQKPLQTVSAPITSEKTKEEAVKWLSLKAGGSTAEMQSPQKTDTVDDIAIIGMSGRYPMASDLEEFWENLMQGKDCITEIPASRWNYADYYSEQQGAFGKMNTKYGGFIDHADEFDSLFFKISPAEADFMDPQLRIFIETAWHTLEDAGYTPQSMQEETVGVFAGVMYSSYEQYHAILNGTKIPFGVHHASIPNRVSYLMDFRGPSMAVDTVCSSSLTALHLACNSIQRGESTAALVGGVNLTLHPNKLIVLSQNKFMSAEGKCRSFGDGGDGYVAGEGCGAILIKPLQRAIAAHDHIYAVIKGTAVSGSGKTNGFRVPNPTAQARVIQSAYQSAGISPSTVQYIEAHGTGTQLGDPIEIEGLCKAFQNDADALAGRKIAIGSVKSNIGHLEAASGMASLMKVLLQMQHQTLTPSLHSSKLNHLIDFDAAPFRVQQECEAWDRTVCQTADGERIMPRRAGISSFGAGGCNAHIVLEEYQAETLPAVPSCQEVLLLSAKDEERLRAYAERLLAYLEKQMREKTKQDASKEMMQTILQAVQNTTAYTLPSDAAELSFEELGFDEYQYQLFLEHLRKQTAVQTESEWLYRYPKLSQLAAYLGAQQPCVSENAEDEQLLHHLAFTLQNGRVELEARLALTASTLSEAVEKLRHYLANAGAAEGVWTGHLSGRKGQEHPWMQLFSSSGAAAMKEMNAEQLAEIWCAGVSVPWNALFSHQNCRRISLPVYPFAPVKHWLTGYDDGSLASETGTSDRIHPLVEKNASDLSGLRFETTWNGQEFALRNHIVRGVRMLPAVAYAEMMRAVCLNLHGLAVDAQQAVCMHNVTIHQPLTVEEQPKTALIQCKAQSDGSISFVVSQKGDAARRFCTGKVLLLDSEQRTMPDAESVWQNFHENWMNAAQIYELFDAVGIHYGKPFQCIQAVQKQSNRVIAKICCPQDTEAKRYYYHLGAADAALQLAMAYFMPQQSDETNHAALSTRIPVSFGRIEMFRPFSETLWGIVQPSATSAGGKNLTALDIMLYREDGTLAMRWCDVLYMAYGGMQTEQLTPLPSNTADSDLVFLHPVRRDTPNDKQAEYSENIIILCGTKRFCEELQPKLKGTVLPMICESELPQGEAYCRMASQLLQKLQQLIRDVKQPALIQLLASSEAETEGFIGLNAMLKTLSQEYPRFTCQFLQMDTDETISATEALLAVGRKYPMESVIRCQNGCFSYTALEEVHPSANAAIPWKPNGTYILFGGTGGLGCHLCDEIFRTVQQANVVVAGRSEEAKAREKMAAQMKNCAKITYQQADVCVLAEVEQVIRSTVEKYGKIDGILFLSGVIRDRLMVQKSTEDLETVLRTKVMGICNIDAASKSLEMDFLILFSSLSGVLGNAGQCDYAAANAFMDAFAEKREQLRKRNQRSGRTVSINFPLCADGGMHNQQQAAAAMKRGLGIELMRKENVSYALRVGLSEAGHQLIPLEGETAKIKSILLQKAIPTEKTTAIPAAQPQIPQEELQTRFGNYLKNLLSPILKVPTAQIDACVNLEDYGIDSVVIMRVTEQLSSAFQNIPQKLFFEHQTIAELSAYFCEHDAETVCKVLEIGKSSAVPKQKTADLRIKPSVQSVQTSVGTVSDEIAIIGMAGIYPQADDLDEFWENLLAGKDCVTEIPKERWDCDAYYAAESGVKNKTNAKWGGFLRHPDTFDPLFFHISPREAKALDPQERLFLECVYHAVEDAGYTKETLGRRTAYGMQNYVGVFVGVMYEEYQLYAAMQQAQGNMITLGASQASIANRVSYYCGFHGPSMALDSMCSSSLASVHLACRSILNGECEAAVAGGVNLSIHPNKFLMLGQNGFAAKDGRCRSFGEGGTGYTPGEGVGAIVLKRLSQAEQDGDHIYAVIKGSALNHGGKVNGYSVPNPRAQSAVIMQALANAHMQPEQINYLEAHGTGTALGDPIEIEALEQVFHDVSVKIPIGSVKSNIGHCEGAAGIAALTKVLLQMQHRTLVPSLHSSVLNPRIDFDHSHFEVVQNARPWSTQMNGQPMCAGISAFGAGGANAHIILKAYEANTEEAVTENVPYLFIFSAEKPAQLKRLADSMCRWLQGQEENSNLLRSIAFTLQQGREERKERLGVIASSIAELRSKLNDYLNERGDYFCGTADVGSSAVQQFCSDADGMEMMKKWYQEGKYYKILEFWVQGIRIPWKELAEQNAVRRVSLPQYPFEQVRCWYDAETALLQEVPQEKTPVSAAVTTVCSTEEPKQRNAVKTGEILRSILKFLSDELMIAEEDMDWNRSFTDFGVDSLMGMKMVDMLSAAYGLDVSATELYDYPNIRAFADYLESQLTQDTTPQNAVSQPTVSDAPTPKESDLDALFSQIYDGELDVDAAKQMLSEMEK